MISKYKPARKSRCHSLEESRISAMDMEKVNSMGFSEFVDVFGNVIEKCPLVAAAVWSRRPFSGSEDLEKHFFDFIDALPRSGKTSGPCAQSDFRYRIEKYFRLA